MDESIQQNENHRNSMHIDFTTQSDDPDRIDIIEEEGRQISSQHQSKALMKETILEYEKGTHYGTRKNSEYSYANIVPDSVGGSTSRYEVPKIDSLHSLNASDSAMPVNSGVVTMMPENKY